MQSRNSQTGRALTCVSASSRAFHAAAAFAFALLVLPGLACGETVGDARQLSRLGDPLRVAIPLRPDGGPLLNDRCIALAAPAQSDGLPHILTANVAVERDAAGGALLITTSTPVREPVVRILLRTTCDGATRQYTLFLEPPGSTRQIRAVGQPGPQVAPAQGPANAAAATGPQTGRSNGRDETQRTPSTAPVVTVIPVVPAPAKRGPVEADAKAAQASNAPPLLAAASPSAPRGIEPERAPELSSAPSPVSPAAPAQPAAAALEAENQTLKQQVAALAGELQRLQQSPSTQQAPSGASVAAGSASALAAPRWELAWPVLVALAGLAALIVGGFMWRRRHHPADEWMLTGPPSHRLASRTSLAEEPVPFKQAGVRTDIRPEDAAAGATTIALANAHDAAPPPATLRLQPSAEDLGRELEQELFVAERAHSALERAHPEIVDALTRCWGTAAARHQLARMLDSASPELARMSGEAVAELRMLLRVAEDPNPRDDLDSTPRTVSPPAPAW